MEGGRLNETKQTSSPLSVQEKTERVLTRSATPGPISEGEGEKGHSEATQSEPLPAVRQVPRLEQSRGAGQRVEGSPQKKEERKVLETAKETPHPKDSEEAKSPVPGEKKKEGTYADAPKIPSPRTEIMAYQQTEPKGAGIEKAPSPDREKMKRELAVQGKSLAALKPLREITLRITDRKKVIPRLRELVKQFGGEVVSTEGDLFFASLPTGSFPEFEKELAGFSTSAKADQLIAKKDTAGNSKLEEAAKRKEGDGKSKGQGRLAADTESRTNVRILLVEE